MIRRTFHPLLLLAMAAIPAVSAAADPDPYEAGFRERAEIYLGKMREIDPKEVTEWAARINLGDPHKYAMPPILARLSHDPADARSLAAYRDLMEVDRGKDDRGLYHFAAYFRTRLAFSLRDRLPPDIWESNEHDARNWFHIMQRGGTENHAFMHRASGLVWAQRLEGPIPGAREGSDPRRELETWLEDTVRRMLTIGMGEYCSSTYLAFSAASLSSVVDFSPDERTRDLARAGMDWIAAAVALKYFHGCTVGPESRGFAARAVSTPTDWMAWLWFGGSARDVTDDPPTRVTRHAVTALALSGYRPPPAIVALARKEVDLPFTARNSKPAYYGPQGNKDQEILFVGRHTAMGTLYSPEGGVRVVGTILPQTTMFKAALLGDDDVHTFGAANGYHRHYPIEGRTPYDQYHQAGDAALNLCWVPADEDERTVHRSIFGAPLALGDPVEDGGWVFWSTGQGHIAARPLNGQAAFAEVASAPRDPLHRWLVSLGRLGGWAIQLGEAPTYPDLDAFRRAVVEKVAVDTSRLESHREARMTSLAGDVLVIRHTGGPGGRPDASTNGQALTWDDWPVYDSPPLRQALGSGRMVIEAGGHRHVLDLEPLLAKTDSGP